MRILVVSDTHLPGRAHALPRGVMDALESGPDAILHAGDFTSPATLQHFELDDAFVGVSGNMDPGDVKSYLPEERLLELGGLRVGLLHGDGPGRGPDMFDRLATWFSDVDLVISGHTHSPHLVIREGIYLFNPGSCTDPRDGSPPSLGWIDLSGDDEPRFTFVPLGAREC